MEKRPRVYLLLCEELLNKQISDKHPNCGDEAIAMELIYEIRKFLEENPGVEKMVAERMREL